MADYYVDLDGNITKKKKKKKQNTTPSYTVDLDGNITKVKEEPVKKTVTTSKDKDDKDGWLSTGSFDKKNYEKLGFVDKIWQGASDVTNTAAGTVADIGVGVAKGLFSTVEGVKDLAQYGVAGVSDLVGADKFAQILRNQAQENDANALFGGLQDAIAPSSLLGTKGRAVPEALGNVAAILLTGGLGSAAGLGKVGVTALTTGVTGTSSMGSGMSEAYNEGATDEEAVTYGFIKGTADAGTELLFGGLGKAVGATGLSTGLSSADDMLAQKVSSKISNQIAKNFVEYGIKAGAEGSEEVLAGVLSAIGKKVTYMEEEELSQLLKDENLLDQFIVGAVTSGIAQSGYVPGMTEGSLREANKTGRDFITGLTQNEQKVIDSVVESRVSEAETEGKKLTNKEKGKIQEEVRTELSKGYIDIDTIERTLGGETFNQYKTMTDEETLLQDKIKSLENTKSISERKQLVEAKEQLEALQKDTERTQRKTQLEEQLHTEVDKLTENDTFLRESYNERTRRGQSFEADVEQYTGKGKEIVQRAIDSGKMNNTRRTHDFVDFLAKISTDKGVDFDFTNNEELQKLGLALEGKTVNGYVEGSNITLNLQSNKALNKVVGHEVTHLFDGTDAYTELVQAVKQYAETKGEWQTRYDALSKLYEGVENVNIENELTADIIGDYLFTDSDFVNKLSVEKPNIFKKIYEEIKYLLKVATAGSKEARELEKVKRAFEKAYKNSGNSDSNIKYSLEQTSDGDTYVRAEKNTFLKEDGTLASEREIFNSLVGKTITLPEGDVKIVKRLPSKDMYNELSKRYPKHLDGVENVKQLNSDVNQNMEELLSNSEAKSLNEPDVDGRHQKQGISSFDTRTVKFYDGDKAYDIEFSIATLQSGEKVAYAKKFFGYDDTLTKKIQTAETRSEKSPLNQQSAFDNSVPQNSKNASGNVKYSLTEDSEGNTLNPVVQKRFTNSKAVDENGNLKVLYHGTPSGEFSIFDKSKGSVEGDFGSGFYFTDNEADVEANYEGGGPDFENKVSRRAEQIEQEEDIDYDEAEKIAREELYVDAHKFQVYLNIENPAIVGETTLLSQDEYHEQYDESDFEDYDEYIAEVEQLVTDDIESIVWDIEQNIDLYGDTSGIANVLYEAYYEGGIDIAGLKERINELYLEDSDGNMVGNEVTRQIIESLGYDGIIDSTVSSKFSNMGMEEGTTHYIVFKPNQIKSITNQNPTDNPDINLSLSEQGQQTTPTGKWNVYGKDIALEQAPVKETATQETEQSGEVTETVDEFAPMTEQEAVAREESDFDAFMSIVDSDMPPETEAPIYEQTEVKNPFDERDIKDVGNRQVKAYMYENPEVKPYFQEEAQVMLGELQRSVKGEKHFNDKLYYDTNGENGWFGTKRETSEEIAYLLDNFKYTYADIEKGLKAIIEDNGKENNAISKRIEFMLDERLRDGHTDFETGMDIPANEGYINLLANKQITEYSDEAYNEWVKSLGNTEEIAPTRQYEAIEPRRNEGYTEEETEWANNKMARSDRPRKNDGKTQRRWVETSTESEVVNREILPDDLDQSAIYYEPIPNKTTLSKANSNLDRMGYDKALSYFNAQLEGNKVQLEDVALGERLLQEAMKKGDTKTAGELIQNIAILGTELGQKVQALSIIQRMTPEGQLKMLQKIVNRGKAKGDKAYNGVEITQEMIDYILKTYNKDGSFDQDKLNDAVESVKKKIADQMKVTAMDKVNAWRYLSMLGNPKTHIRNLVSNVFMTGTMRVKDAVARTVETIAPIKDRTKTWRSASEDVKKFAEQTTAEMKDVLSSENGYSEDATIKSKRDIFKNKILNGVYEFNNNLLTKEDWWFKKSAFRRSFQEYLTANGIKTQEDIKNNPELVEKAKNYAVEQAQIATFQQYSWLANWISGLERKNVGTQIGVGATLPFKKTPINIAKTGLSYSPLGFAKTLTYDVAQVKKGNMQASELIDHLAQNTVGSALVYVGYMLAMSGFLNGGGEDDKESKYDYQLGEQSYSLSIDGKTYSLSWLSPVAMPLFIGANAYEMFEQDKELTFDTTADALAKTLDPMSEMSFLSSLDSVMKSYESGFGKFAGIGEAMLQNYVTQFVPTLSSQVATVLDDKKRDTKVAADSEAKIPEQTLNKLLYKIPFLRETLEPSTDIWGNEVKQTEKTLTRAFETFIAPYSRKDNIATEIDKEIKDLYSKTGEDGLIPKVPQSNVKYDGVTYKMSAKEYTDYKKTYGQTANDLLEDLFKTTTYQNSDPNDKAEMVGEVYKYARDKAKIEYLDKEGVVYTNSTEDKMPVYKENKIKGAIENDMSLDEFDLFNKSKGKYYISKAIGGYEAYDSYNNAINDIEGDDRKAHVESYINGLPLDYGSKILLFTSKYPKDDTYKADVLEYLKGRSDITYDEMVEILTELNYEVYQDGTVRW